MASQPNAYPLRLDETITKKVKKLAVVFLSIPIKFVKLIDLMLFLFVVQFLVVAFLNLRELLIKFFRSFNQSSKVNTLRIHLDNIISVFTMSTL